MKYSVASEVLSTPSNDTPKRAPSPAVTATKSGKRPHESRERLKDYDMNDILNQIIKETKKVADLVRAAPLEIPFLINAIM